MSDSRPSTDAPLATDARPSTDAPLVTDPRPSADAPLETDPRPSVEPKNGRTRREMLRITAVAGIGAAFGGGLASGILREARLRRVTETRPRLGTVVTLTVVAPDDAEARSWITDAFAEMERLEGLLSRHRDDTPVGRLNREGMIAGAPPELLEVLATAEEVSRRSEGAFDVTILPLLRLWEQAGGGRGASRNPSTARPTEAALYQALERVDHRALRIEGDVVRFGRPGMAVTLDGIAKGYVVDRTVEVLARRGADRVLVDAGGDMASAGPGSAAEPWTVGIQDPHRDGLAGFVRLSGSSIATSGDYLNSFTEDRTAHHIIDPRTGRSPETTSSVSVVASSAMRADALSTAAMVLGPVAGCALLEHLSDAEGLIVGKDGRRARTAGFGNARA